jgi:hypothetical protein
MKPRVSCRPYECLFASKKVDYCGQAIGILVADTDVSPWSFCLFVCLPVCPFVCFLMCRRRINNGTREESRR